MVTEECIAVFLNLKDWHRIIESLRRAGFHELANDVAIIVYSELKLYKAID